jgi:hypothetical protein
MRHREVKRPAASIDQPNLCGWAYVSAARLQESKDQGWELIGPAQPSANRAGLRRSFRIEAFNIDIAKPCARCPSGYFSTQCNWLEQAKRQKVSFRFEWSYHCQSCPLPSECVPAGQCHRTIVVGQHHELCSSGVATNKLNSSKFKARMQQSGHRLATAGRLKIPSANWSALIVYAEVVIAAWPSGLEADLSQKVQTLSSGVAC